MHKKHKVAVHYPDDKHPFFIIAFINTWYVRAAPGGQDVGKRRFRRGDEVPRGGPAVVRHVGREGIHSAGLRGGGDLPKTGNEAFLLPCAFQHANLLSLGLKRVALDPFSPPTGICRDASVRWKLSHPAS